MSESIQSRVCRECQWFEAGPPAECNPLKFARRGVTTPLRKCVIGWQHEVIEHIDDGRLLEIGYGNDTEIRRTIHNHNRRELDTHIEWWGVTPRKKSRPEARVYNGTAQALPFCDDWFDCVCAHQTMEHWYQETWDDASELIAKLGIALRSIRRVLKPGGKFHCDVPIHSHGGCIFREGAIVDICDLFSRVFVDVRAEDRRRYFEPLEVVKHLEGRPPAYILTITATKGADDAD